MTASQRTANPNGCAEPTKKEDDGIDTNIEALEEYICENICRYSRRRFKSKRNWIISAITVNCRSIQTGSKQNMTRSITLTIARL